LFIREIIKTIDGLKLKEGDRRKVYFGNAIRMLKLALPQAPAAASKASRPKPSKRKAKLGKAKGGKRK
jgi:hypothetical protein